jgi:hypothetical protein
LTGSFQMEVDGDIRGAFGDVAREYQRFEETTPRRNKFGQNPQCYGNGACKEHKHRTKARKIHQKIH